MSRVYDVYAMRDIAAGTVLSDYDNKETSDQAPPRKRTHRRSGS
jgi:hypothetical protein